MAYTQTMLAANTPIKYSMKLIDLLYNETMYKKVTNTDFEGDIKNEGDRVRVRTLGKLNLVPYSKGMSLATQDLAPIFEDLIVDQQFYFKFVVDDIDKLQNDVDTINKYAATGKRDMAQVIDVDILKYMARNVDGDNALGTAYATGTVAVAVTTGVVTGTGTTFTANMVGGYFRALGHTKSYLVTAFTSATSITVSDLGTVTGETGVYGSTLALTGGSYTGGAIGAGATFNIRAATALSVTNTNIYANLVDLGTVLGEKLTPEEGRFIVVNSKFKGALRKAPEFIPAVGRAYEDVVLGASIGEIAGFQVFSSELVYGNNTNGFYYIAGTRDYCAMALQIMKTSIVSSENDPNSFVTTVKGLLVWGRKVFEGNRGRGAVLKAVIA
jgi:hypothetical protein